jgi:hypothetical protein
MQVGGCGAVGANGCLVGTRPNCCRLEYLGSCISFGVVAFCRLGGYSGYVIKVNLSSKDLDMNTDFVCHDCGVDTLGLGEYYMVHSWIWEVYGTGDGMLCVGCLEARLGNELVGSDFLDCELNTNHVVYPKSPRLLERIGKCEQASLYEDH